LRHQHEQGCSGSQPETHQFSLRSHGSDLRVAQERLTPLPTLG
jgi:hypothetical protein